MALLCLLFSAWNQNLLRLAHPINYYFCVRNSILLFVIPENRFHRHSNSAAARNSFACRRFRYGWVYCLFIWCVSCTRKEWETKQSLHHKNTQNIRYIKIRRGLRQVPNFMSAPNIISTLKGLFLGNFIHRHYITIVDAT